MESAGSSTLPRFLPKDPQKSSSFGSRTYPSILKDFAHRRGLSRELSANLPPAVVLADQADRAAPGQPTYVSWDPVDARCAVPKSSSILDDTLERASDVISQDEEWESSRNDSTFPASITSVSPERDRGSKDCDTTINISEIISQAEKLYGEGNFSVLKSNPSATYVKNCVGDLTKCSLVHASFVESDPVSSYYTQTPIRNKYEPRLLSFKQFPDMPTRFNGECTVDSPGRLQGQMKKKSYILSDSVKIVRSKKKHFFNPLILKKNYSLLKGKLSQENHKRTVMATFCVIFVGLLIFALCIWLYVVMFS